MRIDLLIAGIIILVLGFAIGGPLGNIFLIVGILILLYVLFSRESPRGLPESNKYIESTDYLKDNEGHEIENKGRFKNRNQAERELRAWNANNQIKKCSECGSTNNPADAKFCADCGKKLRQ